MAGVVTAISSIGEFMGRGEDQQQEGKCSDGCDGIERQPLRRREHSHKGGHAHVLGAMESDG